MISPHLIGARGATDVRSSSVRGRVPRCTGRVRGISLFSSSCAQAALPNFVDSSREGLIQLFRRRL
jgi:hypothetical protein